MMLDWNEYQKQIGAALGDIAKVAPDVIRGYRTLSDAGQKTAKLDAKTRELIAIGVGVTRQCDGCIVVQTDAALRHGATR